jgi:hypothetical protein
MEVQPRDVAFVVQGPYVRLPNGKDTGQVFSSIRRHFPESQLVFSTWEGALPENLDIDDLIQSADPGGPQVDTVLPAVHSANRQLKSSWLGMTQVNRPYTVRLRSDLAVTANRLLKWIASPVRVLHRNADSAIGQGRILLCNTLTVNPLRGCCLPFHACDWFYAGNTDDIRQLFAAAPFPEREWARWFDWNPRPDECCLPTSTARYQPETYIWWMYNKPVCLFELESSFDNRSEVIRASEECFAANSVILSPRQLGIVSLKRRIRPALVDTTYTFREWQSLQGRFEGRYSFVKRVDWQRLAATLDKSFGNPLWRALDKAVLAGRKAKTWPR